MFKRQLMATVFRAPEDDSGSTYEDYNVDELEVDPDIYDVEEEQNEPGEGPDDLEEPAPHPSRGANRVAEATRIAAEAKAEAAALREEIARARSAGNPDQQREAAQQRAERLRMMSPDERTDFLLAEQDRKFEARLAQQEFNTNDRADATAFDSLCARNPAAAKLKADVEKQLATMRANGTTAPRETVLKYLLGERMLSKAPKARAAQAGRAAAGIARNTARPAGGRSDVSGGSTRGGSEAEARAQRLANVKL